MNAASIFLIGLMGAGKTTIGRRLAKQMQLEFVDADQVLEARCGVSINAIFELEGEAGFRVRESQLLDELTQRAGIVLSTGGGAVLDPLNREWLKTRGTVLYLHATAAVLRHRTRLDRNRPLLQTANPLATLEALYRQRDPLYRQIAHHVVEVSRLAPTAVVANLVNMLGNTTP